MSPRVLVVTTSYPRDDDDPSGHFVQSHARALAAAGASVHVIAPFGRATAAPESRPPLVLHPAGGAMLFGFPGALARAGENPLRLAGGAVFAAGVRQRLRQLAPFDRLVAHWIVPSAWPLLAGTTAPLDIVSHGADVRLLAALPDFARAAILGSLLDRGARFQFVATHLLDVLAAALPAALAARLRAASRVEPAPIELPEVSAAAAARRASLALDPGQALALCVGRLVPGKRFHLAIEALAGLASRPHLVLVGDGPEGARLAALARASGVRATFTGVLPRTAALAWIAAAEVLVHPSASEGAPTVIREARALGTRVVACPVGDVERWAERDAGIAITTAAPAAIGAAIAAAIARGCDCRS